jgi:hypothetical protein
VGHVNGDVDASARYAAPVALTEPTPSVDATRGVSSGIDLADRSMPAPRSLQERFGGATRVDLRELRIGGAAMLGVAAVRPLVPFEFVPPCPLRTITGIPCPMCGMTRGVTALVHGDFVHALLMNPASYLAVALAILVLVQWRTRRVVIPVWLIVTGLAGMWAWQMFKYATGRPL